MLLVTASRMYFFMDRRKVFRRIYWSMYLRCERTVSHQRTWRLQYDPGTTVLPTTFLPSLFGKDFNLVIQEMPLVTFILPERSYRRVKKDSIGEYTFENML